MALKNNLVEIDYDWNDKVVPSLIDRCPTGVITLGKFAGSLADQADELSLKPWEYNTGQRDFKNGYSYGMRW